MIKVMHIDSDAQMREMVDMVLCLTGEFIVMPCEDGDEAISQLSIFGPEVVLIDLAQKGDEAKRTLAAIQAMPDFSDVPVIMVASEAQSVDSGALRAAGAVDVIAKPFDPVGLAARIRGALPTYV